MASSGHIASAAGEQPRSALRSIVVLFLLSLAVRLAVWACVAWSAMPPIHDEVSYVRRGVVCGHLVTACVRGGILWAELSENDLSAAYCRGIWPPLHPLLIGLAFAVFGEGLALARLVIVIQSALTTCVVFALTARLATRRAALVAAGIHIVYPSFLAYSHLLWSETTYILMCLTALYFVVRVVHGNHLSYQVLFSVLAGVFLGLAGLTRAAVLPLLIVVPVWLLWRVKDLKRRLLLPPVLLCTYVVVLLPWQTALWAREHRFVLLSTKTGYYLYEGNNPWLAQDDGISRMRDEIEAYMREHDVSRDEAGRTLAKTYIRQDVGGFVRRCFQRLRTLWAPDWSLVRHVLTGTYPPLPHGAVRVVLAVVALSLPLLVTCILYGLCCRSIPFRDRSLLVLSVLFSMLPSVLCIANSRLTLPLLALLLPAAGVGLVAVARRGTWIRGVLVLVVVSAGLWVLNPRMPANALGVDNRISAYHGPVLASIERVCGNTGAAMHDRVYLRQTENRPPKTVQLTLTSSQYTFHPFERRTIVIKGLTSERPYAVRPHSPDVVLPPPLIEIALPSGRSTQFRPLQPDAWRHWRPTGLPGIEYYWAGSIAASDVHTQLIFSEGALPFELP